MRHLAALFPCPVGREGGRQARLGASAGGWRPFRGLFPPAGTYYSRASARFFGFFPSPGHPPGEGRHPEPHAQAEESLPFSPPSPSVLATWLIRPRGAGFPDLSRRAKKWQDLRFYSEFLHSETKKRSPFFLFKRILPGSGSQKWVSSTTWPARGTRTLRLPY